MQYQPLIPDSQYFVFNPCNSTVTSGGYDYVETSLSPKCVKNEDMDAYIVTFDVPGVSKEDLGVTITEGLIVIEGERNGKPAFSTIRELPCDIEVAKISASLKDGVLTVVFPKAKSIKVKVQ